MEMKKMIETGSGRLRTGKEGKRWMIEETHESANLFSTMGIED